MEEGRHTAHPTEGKIGRLLQRARRDRGLSLEEAERSTKIHKRYLVGLERDDYTVLPDAVYARGFLKTYANFLGLDGDGLSRELGAREKPRRERAPGYAPPAKSGPGRQTGGPRRVSGAKRRRTPKSTAGTAAAAVLVLAALVGALYFVGLNVRSSAVDDARQAERIAAPVDPDGEPSGNSSDNAPSGDNSSDNAPSGDVPSDSLTVGVEVEGAPAWLRVSSDSETVFEDIAQPGFSRTFEARRVVGIRAGDAGAVSVRVNGQDVGALGEPGEVLDRDFTLKTAS